MASKYLQLFPRPLLDDLVAGRWLPVIGAGFSRNAVLPSSKQMPLWADLGSHLASDLGDYVPTSALDAVSAYEHEYGRPRLIERLSELLLVNDARPGDAHRAFCAIPFDIVCTTNFDFLLERQYELIPRHCTPLVDEDQLAVNLREPEIALLKFHGDLHHPSRLVATETDYDRFLDKYPLLATFLANLLITRTAVLLGYSLDDPDFRQLWQVVGERLGRSRRTAYAIAVGLKQTDISRFERRGVKVINLPGGRVRYTQVLTEALTELRDYWQANVISASQVKEEQPLRELSLPPDAQTRLCFFAVPLAFLSFYRDRVFPLVRDSGFVPVSADDVVAPGDSVAPKIEALISRAVLVVVDASTHNTVAEQRVAMERLEHSRILTIVPERAQPARDYYPIQDSRLLIRPDIAAVDVEEFLSQIHDWLTEAARRFRPALFDEPSRLLKAGEYRAAVIAAITLLESDLRQRLDLPTTRSSRPVTFKQLLIQIRFQDERNYGKLLWLLWLREPRQWRDLGGWTKLC